MPIHGGYGWGGHTGPAASSPGTVAPQWYNPNFAFVPNDGGTGNDVMIDFMGTLFDGGSGNDVIIT